ncbi:MAG: 16S rRNA (uracil(1498)-N(3))-methyltransferase [Bacteroidia bacterium]|nr:16S rRNA (uracil(1498)-N(3))-methyltransferase [Bacteroidia bacterium]
MHLFYTPDLPAEALTLSGEEAHHLVHVLRMQPGMQVRVTNGKGRLATCEITTVSKKDVALQVLETSVFDAPRRKLHIGIAPTKNIDRFEWFVEKATEIGIVEITPLICRRSERKVINAERINKLIVAAAKQSLHYHFPLLQEAVHFDRYIERNPGGFIAHCEAGSKEPVSVLRKVDSATVLIGPEGDFHPEEIVLAQQAGCIPLSLGESRLRTETAGIMAVAVFNN